MQRGFRASGIEHKIVSDQLSVTMHAWGRPVKRRPLCRHRDSHRDGMGRAIRIPNWTPSRARIMMCDNPEWAVSRTSWSGCGAWASFRENDIDKTVLPTWLRRISRSLASRRLGTAASSWMRSLLERESARKRRRIKRP
jgi:hypothetical protein